MKKIAPYVIVFLAALLVMNLFNYSHDMHFVLDGDDIDGPVGAFFGLLAGGIGLLVGGVVVLVVGAILAVVFAGIGVFALIAVIVALVLAALALSPLLLPLLIPVAIIWFFASRSRRNRERAAALKAEPV
jgi:hypothetical protein